MTEDERALAFMREPKQWPQWPMLPLARKDDSGMTGYLIAGEGPKVWDGNIWDRKPPSSYWGYPDFEHVVKYWRVD